MNSVRHTEVLWESLFNFTEEFHQSGAKFQQDNAPDYTSAHAAGWFLVNVNLVFPWFARSTDRNPIENFAAFLQERCTQIRVNLTT